MTALDNRGNQERYDVIGLRLSVDSVTRRS